MPKKRDVKIGEQFGKWTFLGEISHQGPSRTLKCRCACGTEKFVLISSLLTGRSTSCGCNLKTHGMTNTRMYNIFDKMKQRCNNPNNFNYPNYGGRGIKILWNSFEEFYNDMYESYEEHVKEYGEEETTIDRIDGNGNYCKENCRWATRKVQCNNLRTNVKVTYKGKEYTSMAALCEEYGVKRTTIDMRIKKYGMTLEEAIEKKTVGMTKDWIHISYNGVEYNSLSELCRDLGIVHCTIINRCREKGITLEESINISLQLKKEKDVKNGEKVFFTSPTLRE